MLCVIPYIGQLNSKTIFILRYTAYRIYTYYIANYMEGVELAIKIIICRHRIVALRNRVYRYMYKRLNGVCALHTIL